MIDWILTCWEVSSGMLQDCPMSFKGAELVQVDGQVLVIDGVEGFGLVDNLPEPFPDRCRVIG